jgi:nucleotide-binding universal stress UspA family protein
MKFKPASRPGGLTVELGPKETQLPIDSAASFGMHRILVPLDFSECSRKALTYALAFARQFQARLTLLHVIEPYVPVPELSVVAPEPVEQQLRETAVRELEETQRALGGSDRAETLMRTGTPFVVITETAQELGSELIIISTHGHTGLAHILLGSTAEKVIRHAPCPVLVVRQIEHEFVTKYQMPGRQTVPVYEGETWTV